MTLTDATAAFSMNLSDATAAFMNTPSKSGKNNFSAALDKVDENNQDDITSFEGWRIHAKRWMKTSTFGYIYHEILNFLGIFSCLNYIVETYFDNELSQNYFQNLEILLSCKSE
jgi:outer membrane cobalamin receptor